MIENWENAGKKQVKRVRFVEPSKTYVEVLKGRNFTNDTTISRIKRIDQKHKIAHKFAKRGFYSD